jgi:hypothetical protein
MTETDPFFVDKNETLDTRIAVSNEFRAHRVSLVKRIVEGVIELFEKVDKLENVRCLVSAYSEIIVFQHEFASARFYVEPLGIGMLHSVSCSHTAHDPIQEVAGQQLDPVKVWNVARALFRDQKNKVKEVKLKPPDRLSWLIPIAEAAGFQIEPDTDPYSCVRAVQSHVDLNVMPNTAFIRVQLPNGVPELSVRIAAEISALVDAALKNHC